MGNFWETYEKNGNFSETFVKKWQLSSNFLQNLVQLLGKFRASCVQTYLSFTIHKHMSWTDSENSGS